MVKQGHVYLLVQSYLRQGARQYSPSTVPNKGKWNEVKVAQLCPTLCNTVDCSPWNSPDQNSGVGSLSLIQGISPIQGLNPGLSHCRQILYQLSHKGRPRILEWVAYPFSRGSSQPRNRTGVSCIVGKMFAKCLLMWLVWDCIFQGVLSRSLRRGLGPLLPLHWQCRSSTLVWWSCADSSSNASAQARRESLGWRPGGNLSHSLLFASSIYRLLTLLGSSAGY